MKNALAQLLYLGMTCLLAVGCQTLDQERILVDAKPTPAKPIPVWAKGDNAPRGDQQVLITTKLIEITRPTGSSDIPTKRYERKLSDPQLQAYIRDLSQKKGADLLTAPSVVTRDGQSAAVELIREFVYPVAPGEDAKNEIENVGVTSHFDAKLVAGSNISIKTFTRVCEFEGYSEVQPGFDLPVFKRRDIEASARLKNGETIVVGGILDDKSQEIEETGPLGIIKKSSTHQLSRELIIAVTVRLVNPDGSQLAAR